MAHFWQHLTPGDSFVVYRENPQAIDDMFRLIHLYQPIIGTDAISLYVTLDTYLSVHTSGYSQSDYHRSLMSLLAMSLDRILDAREQLEGIGLLRVKRQIEENESRTYYYSLIRPLSGAEFFSSDVLSVVLFHRLGKLKYKEIRSRYLPSVGKVPNAADLTDITKGFDEVFASISPSELVVQPGTESYHFLFEGLVQAAASVEQKEARGITLKRKIIDFDEVIGRMGRVFQPDKKLTEPVRNGIEQIAFFYQCDETLIATCLHDQRVYTKEDEIDLEKVREWVKEHYKEKHANRPPKLVTKRSLQKITQIEEGANDTPEEQHRRKLETLSPLQLLEAYHQGSKIADADVQLVESLVTQFGLPFGVVNVLIDYVMLTNNYKLPKQLTEKIAGHWKRLGVETVKQAQELARQEHKVYHDWKDTKHATDAKPKKTASKTATKRSKLPESVQEQLRKEQTGASDQGSSMSDAEWLEKERRAQELLRALGEID